MTTVGVSGQHAVTFKDLKGLRFGAYEALEYVGTVSEKNLHAVWRCRCDCGVEKNVRAQGLLVGTASRCDECRRKRTLIVCIPPMNRRRRELCAAARAKKAARAKRARRQR